MKKIKMYFKKLKERFLVKFYTGIKNLILPVLRDWAEKEYSPALQSWLEDEYAKYITIWADKYYTRKKSTSNQYIAFCEFLKP